ncbi:MAG: hypothetical protein HOW59_00360, partial [Nonomuraea sp.]|nr:hypothetical protein [Nonomuraea sp.]
EDPATGNPRPTSPVEKLRQDLDRLQGAADDKSLTVLLTMSALSQRDLGAWQAAEDLRLSTDRARSTMEGAIQRVWTVYSSVIQALDDTIKTAKAADRSVAADVRTRP